MTTFYEYDVDENEFEQELLEEAVTAEEAAAAAAIMQEKRRLIRAKKKEQEKAMRRMRIVASALALALLLALPAGAAQSIEFYKELVEENNIGKISVFWSEDLTTEILENRHDALIIEKVIGVVIDENGNGEVLNPVDPDFNYISYASVSGVTTGDVVMTLFVYNPATDAVDDIIDRVDFIIDH